jgi:hypothetical protein
MASSKRIAKKKPRRDSRMDVLEARVGVLQDVIAEITTRALAHRTDVFWIIGETTYSPEGPFRSYWCGGTPFAGGWSVVELLHKAVRFLRKEDAERTLATLKAGWNEGKFGTWADAAVGSVTNEEARISEERWNAKLRAA